MPQPGGPVARTDLAWRRTALAAAGLAAIALRAGVYRHDARAVVAGALALAAAITFWTCGRLRASTPSARATTALMTAAAVACVAVALAVVVAAA